MKHSLPFDATLGNIERKRLFLIIQFYIEYDQLIPGNQRVLVLALLPVQQELDPKPSSRSDRTSQIPLRFDRRAEYSICDRRRRRKTKWRRAE